MYQQITIVGYLGSEPDMRFTPEGNPVTSFSIATTNKYKNKSGATVEETTWFRVSVWGGQAESCNQYLHKGSPALVVGRLRPDKATGSPEIFTRKDGTMGASFEITAQNVRFLPSKNGVSGENVSSGPEDTTEIPF